MSLFKPLAAFFALFALGACGFHLRSAPALPSELDRTYLAATDRQTPFVRRLRRELEESGIAVVDSPVDATSVLTILDDETGQRVLSVSARNIPREYEVFYRVTFSLQQGERTLLEPQEQAVERSYVYDETLVLGKAREEEQIRNALTDDLVRLVMFQLAAL